MTTVVVVGAGSAGMACARRLSQNGLDVTVVEARARLGGRTWSETLANGHVAERGGEYLDSSMVEVHELAKELGLDTTAQGFNPTVRPTADQNGPSVDELEVGAKELSDYWASLGKLHESVSIQQIIDNSPLSSEIAAVIGARLSSGRAANIARVSAKWSEGGSAGPLISHEHNTRIRQGNQSLSERMGFELGHDRIKLRWPVSSIRRNGHGYTVVNMHGATIEADAVVVAVPVSIVANVDIEGLDHRTKQAIDKIGFGQATKLHLIVEGDCAPGVKQEVGTPFSTWATAGVDSDQAPFVTGFGSTHETQTKLAVAHGPDVFRPRLEAQWPGVKFGTDALLTYWGGDPWTRGAYSYRPTGWNEQDQDFLAAPSGRVFFAGEHTADIHAGYICGALRSGYRAAGEVVEVL